MDNIAYYANAVTLLAFLIIVIKSAMICVLKRSMSNGLIAIGLLIFLLMELDGIFFGSSFTLNGLGGVIEERIPYFSIDLRSYLKMFGSILMLIGFWRLISEMYVKKPNQKLKEDANNNCAF